MSYVLQSVGFTIVDPAECATIPADAQSLLESSYHWTVYGKYSNTLNDCLTFYNGGFVKTLPMCGPQKGDTMAIGIDDKGNLHYFYKGKYMQAICSGIPTDKPLWGYVDLYGRDAEARVEILHSE